MPLTTGPFNSEIGALVEGFLVRVSVAIVTEGSGLLGIDTSETNWPGHKRFTEGEAGIGQYVEGRAGIC